MYATPTDSAFPCGRINRSSANDNRPTKLDEVQALLAEISANAGKADCVDDLPDVLSAALDRHGSPRVLEPTFN